MIICHFDPIDFTIMRTLAVLALDLRVPLLEVVNILEVLFFNRTVQILDVVQLNTAPIQSLIVLIAHLFFWKLFLL